MASGNYSVTAYDKLGCKAGIPNILIPFVNINVDVSLITVKENKCYLDKNGQIISKIENGAQPYDYNWSHGVQYFSNKPLDTISSLPAGLYKLTVTDKEGCTGVSNAILFSEKPTFKYTTEKVVNNKCNTDSSGQIIINISGGKNPIEIFWLDGLYTGFDIKNLPNGLYTGTITDAEGCLIYISSINLTSASDIKINAEIKNDENQTSSGEICISISGGQAPYRFSWSNGAENTNCFLPYFVYIILVPQGDRLQYQFFLLVDALAIQACA